MTDNELISKYNLSKYIPDWTHSRFQERIMRFGIEARLYHHFGDEFDPRDSDCINLIRKSFTDDMVKWIRNNLDLSTDDIIRWIST